MVEGVYSIKMTRIWIIQNVYDGDGLCKDGMECFVGMEWRVLLLDHVKLGEVGDVLAAKMKNIHETNKT